MISEVLFEVRLPNVCFTTKDGVFFLKHRLTQIIIFLICVNLCLIHRSKNLRSFNLGVPKNFPLFARKYINTRHD